MHHAGPSHIGLLLVGNLLVVFYLLIIFTPFQFVRDHYHYYIEIVVLTLGGLFVGSAILPKIAYDIQTGFRYLRSNRVRHAGLGHTIERIHISMDVRKAIVTRTAKWVLPLFKLLLLGTALWLDSRCFDWEDISSKLTSRTLLYLSLLICFLYMAGRVYVLQERLADRQRRRIIQVLGTSVLGLLYYLVVVTFAYSIYPCIPAGRGGGDLAGSPAIRLLCDAQSATAFPPSLIDGIKDGRLTSIPLVSIEEDADSILVVPLAEYEAWHDGGKRVCHQPSIFRVWLGRFKHLRCLERQKPESVQAETKR